MYAYKHIYMYIKIYKNNDEKETKLEYFVLIEKKQFANIFLFSFLIRDAWILL